MRTWVAIVVTAVATAAAMRTLDARAADTIVSATRFQLVDLYGVERGWFGFGPTDTQPRLVLCDGFGVCRLNVALAEPDRKPTITMFDSAGNRATSLSEGDLSMFWTSDPSEAIRLNRFGLSIYYPGQESIVSREAASLAIDGYTSVALRLGQPTDSPFGEPVTGVQLVTERMTPQNLDPRVRVSLTEENVERVLLSNDRFGLAVRNWKNRFQLRK